MKFNSKHRKRYIGIVTILIILFLFFQIISNFTVFMLERETERTVLGENNFNQLFELRDKKLRETKEQDYDKKGSYLLVGEEGQQFTLLKNQLSNMKETYESATFLDTFIVGKKGIFLTKEHYEESEIEILKEATKQGIILYFLKIPLANISADKEFSELLGIKEVRGSGEWDGIRFVADFLISDMIEFPKYRLEFSELTLKQGTKTYVYSLFSQYERNNNESMNEIVEEDIKLTNEELPPIIWRNTYLLESEEESNFVFCVNGDSLIESNAGAGIITALLSHSEEDYLYPVINAYNIVVKGMPFITNFSNKKLEKLYGKNALGIQQDILTPQLFGFFNKYQLYPTYLSVEADKIFDENGFLEKYYNKEIMVQLGELFQYEEKENRLYMTESTIGYEVWTPDFRFYTEQYSAQQINEFLPLIQSSNHYKDEDELSIISANTAYGYLSIYTDVDEILRGDNELSWVEAGKTLGTLLAVQSQTMSHLERMNHSDTVKRLMTYQLLESHIKKQEKEINISLDYFTGEAFYILKTSKEVLEVEHGTYKKIGNNRYMIKFLNDTARIKFR